MLLRNFWPLSWKTYFRKEDWTLALPPPNFDLFLIFSKIRSLKPFDNSWGNFYTMFFILNLKHCFTCGESIPYFSKIMQSSGNILQTIKCTLSVDWVLHKQVFIIDPPLYHAARPFSPSLRSKLAKVKE